MATTKIQSGAFPADVINTASIDDLAVTHAKLHTTMDLSSKTVTLPTLNAKLVVVSPSSAEAINIRGRSADDIGQLKFYENDGTTSLARLDSRTTHFEVGSYNELRLSAGGVGNSHVIIDTSGNIGIGIGSPGTKLQVAGTQNTPSGTSKGMLLVRADGSTHGLQMGVTGSAPWGSWIQAQDNNISSPYPLTLQPGGGNVGIGTTTPNQWASYTDNAATVLQVKDSSQRARIVINGGDGAHLDLVDYAGASNDKHMNMAVDGGILKFGSLNDAGNAFVKNNIMVMDLGSGNVGIGTDSPGYKLEVAGTAHVTNTLSANAISIPSQGMIFNQAFGTGVPSITMTGTANNGRAGAINFKESDGSGGAIANTAAIYSTDGAGGNASYGGLTIAAYQSDIRFSTGSLAGTKMIVQAGGNVGIGTSNPVANLVVSNGGAEGWEIDPALIGSNHNRITNFNRATSTYCSLTTDAASFIHRISGSDNEKLEFVSNGLNLKSATYAILNVQTDVDDNSSSNDGIIKISNGSSGTTKAELRWDESEDKVHISYGDHGRHISIQPNGRVGIGTASGSINNFLHVKSGASGGPQIEIESTSGTANSGFIGFDGTSLQLATQRDMVDGSKRDTGKSWGGINIIGAAGGSKINFTTSPNTNSASTVRVTIDKDGLVGIGTENPVSDLHVDGTIVSTNLAQGTGQLEIQGYGATGYINHSGSGSLRFRMGSSYTEHMSLTPGGQLLASAAGRYTGLNSNAWVTFGRLYGAQSTPLNIKVIVGHNSNGGYNEFTNDTYAYNIAAGTVVTIGNTTGSYTCQIRKVKRIGGQNGIPGAHYNGGDGGWEYQVARNQAYGMSVGLHVMGVTTGWTWTI